MKTKLEKTLIITSIILLIAVIALSVILIFFNPNDVVLNKDKFEYDKETYGPRIFNKTVGDGLFFIEEMRYFLAFMIQHPNDYGNSELILDYVYDYCFENENLYCYALDGFAVAYPESNLCKVLITDLPDDLIKDIESMKLNKGVNKKLSGNYSELLLKEIGYGRYNEEENYRKKELTGDYPENKFVIYLDSFDEFTEYEQKMLLKLKGKHNK